MDNLSNNIQTNSSSEGKISETKRKLDKKTKFSKERIELINKLSQLIGISDKKNTVFLYELENDPNLKKKIEELVPDIKKYYRTCSWGYFSKDPKKGRNNHIALIKSVFFDNDYTVFGTQKINTFNNIKKQYTQLNFIKN